MSKMLRYLSFRVSCSVTVPSLIHRYNVDIRCSDGFRTWRCECPSSPQGRSCVLVNLFLPYSHPRVTYCRGMSKLKSIYFQRTFRRGPSRQHFHLGSILCKASHPMYHKISSQGKQCILITMYKFERVLIQKACMVVVKQSQRGRTGNDIHGVPSNGQGEI